MPKGQKDVEESCSENMETSYTLGKPHDKGQSWTVLERDGAASLGGGCQAEWSVGASEVEGVRWRDSKCLMLQQEHEDHELRSKLIGYLLNTLM